MSSDGKRIYATTHRHIGVWNSENGEFITWLDKSSSNFEQDMQKSMNEELECHRGYIAHSGICISPNVVYT
jgi:hypothetical protein